MINLKVGGIIVAAFIAGAFVASPELRAFAANTVGSADIINNSIQSVDIKDGEVKTNDIAPSAVGSLRIKDNDVKAQDLAADSVGTSEIANGAIIYTDLSRSFVRIEHRDDCNCGGTGWDPNGQNAFGVVHDDAVTFNSVVSISFPFTTAGFSGICWANENGNGFFIVHCDRNIPNGVGLNYAIFNK